LLVGEHQHGGLLQLLYRVPVHHANARGVLGVMVMLSLIRL
jgi:hypothetical protein